MQVAIRMQKYRRDNVWCIWNDHLTYINFSMYIPAYSFCCGHISLYTNPTCRILQQAVRDLLNGTGDYFCTLSQTYAELQYLLLYFMQSLLKSPMITWCLNVINLTGVEAPMWCLNDHYSVIVIP